MKSKEFIKFLDKKTKEIYSNPNSILKKYDDFLAFNGIYHSYDTMAFRKKLKGRVELCDEMIEFYENAIIPNEKIGILDDIYATGYDRDKIVKMIFKIYEQKNDLSNLWEYGDLLYSMKRYKYLPQYLEIIKNKEYGRARQMVVLLVGKSKKVEVIPVLKDLLNDADVEGHALQALANFEGDDIVEIMQQYTNHKMAWIRNTAKKYLNKKESK